MKTDNARSMIVSCGEALVDVISGDGETRTVPGGGPMNTAVASARLGAPTAFVGRVSTDAEGDMIWDHLTVNGVDTRACQRGPEPTAQAIVEHRPELFFRFLGDGTADTALSCADLGPFGPGPHILHGGTLALFRGQTAGHLADLVAGHNGIVSLDPNVRPAMIDDRVEWDRFHDRWLENTDVYRASNEDLEWIWPGLSPADAAAELQQRGVRVVVVTHGSQGAEIYVGGETIAVAGVSTSVVDTVGAGDTFVASLLASLLELGVVTPAALDDLEPSQWRSIGLRAVRAAAVTCSRLGADPPRREDLAAS